MTQSFKGIPGPASRDRPGSFDLYHEPQTERDLVAVSLVELDAIHAVSMSGALGLGTVAVGVEICHGYGIKIGGISDLSRFLTGWDGRTILYFFTRKIIIVNFYKIIFSCILLQDSQTDPGFLTSAKENSIITGRSFTDTSS